MLDRERQTKGFFTRSEFIYDAQANVFTCPNGNLLTSRGLVRDDGTVPYWASTKDCQGCPLKSRCTTGQKRIDHRHRY